MTPLCTELPRNGFIVFHKESTRDWIHRLAYPPQLLCNLNQQKLQLVTAFNLSQQQIHEGKFSCDIIGSRVAASIFRMILDKNPIRTKLFVLLGLSSAHFSRRVNLFFFLHIISP